MWSRSEIEVNLTLIRHSATKSNLEHRYLGTTDEALSEEGKSSLQKRKEKSIYQTPKQLFVSPMLRCRQTAQILFQDLNCQSILEWKEMDFGLFEGKNYRELSKNKLYQEWIDSNATLPFPKGESREHFIKRSLQGFDKMLVNLQKSENDISNTSVAAVVHGGTIMALCSSLFGGDYFDYQVGCGEGYYCHFLYSEKNAKLLELKKIC